jgi:integrase/recombinase XerD
VRALAQKAKSDPALQAVIQATLRLWRRHHLSYDQTRYVAKSVRRALALERPKVRTRVIERLSREDERRLIDTAYRLPGTRGLLIKTLFQTGARVSEFAAIEVEDFFFDEQIILIRKAKGGKHRYVPILPELAQELRTHLRQRMRGYLFETNRNTAFSPRRLQQLVKETAALAGITKRVSPHILRHSVATTLLEQGMPLEQIQQFLGHAQLDTTQIYATATSAMIKKSYQQALSREPGVLTQGC